MRAVGFVRNVMVGRQGLTRTALLDVFEQAGAAAPRSYLSTGNVSFSADDPLDPAFVQRVERGIAAVIDRPEPVFVRTVQRLTTLAKGDPFAPYARTEVHERCVSFLADAPDLSLPMRSARGDVEVFAVEGADVFSVTRLVGGRPGTAGPLLEKAREVKVTTRNWNTIERILRSPDVS